MPEPEKRPQVCGGYAVVSKAVSKDGTYWLPLLHGAYSGRQEAERLVDELAPNLPKDQSLDLQIVECDITFRL
jgi:hypothetical protein